MLSGDLLDLHTLGQIATRLEEVPISYQLDLSLITLIDQSHCATKSSA
jgi:hypothetical protein